MNASRPLFSAVGLANSLELKFRWLGFPGLIRGIIGIHFFMFILLLFQPGAYGIFVFDWESIRQGEWWRVVSFILIPPVGVGATPGVGPLVGVLFMFFAMMIGFLINDSLERVWGVFRTTIYVYATIACQILATFLFRDMSWAIQGTGQQLYLAVFLAFATIFPRYEFRLFFILPVQVWVLGVIAGAIIALNSFRSFEYAMYIYLCFLPYLVWAFPRLLKWGKMRSHTAARQATFKAKVKSASAGAHFHKCDVCGATDESHPDRDFRVTEDDRELCDACLEAETGKREPAGKSP